jgi:outer membrane protein TolC
MIHRIIVPPTGSQSQAARVWFPRADKAMAVALLLFLIGFLPATAQFPGVGSSSGDRQEQQSPAAAPVQPPSTDALSGSGIVDKPVAGTIQLSILDAIDRGLRHNLALLLSQEQTESARAQKRRSLSYLLPNVSGSLNESVNQINLAAFGIPLPQGLTSPIVGPFGVFDARASMNDTVLDFTAMNRVRSAAENEKVARFTVQDARELVVLAVGNEYLITLASAARLETAKAQLTTDQTIFQQTTDMKKAGVAAGIDVLRAQVQMQSQQQRVLASRNQYERQKMVLARLIGLPVSQAFELTDSVPYAPLPQMNFEESLARAYVRRPEYLAAEARVRVAEFSVKAARGEALPTVQVNGAYGWIGPAPGKADATYNLAAGLKIPIFQGGKVKADVNQAETELRQTKMQLENLRNRVEFEVRAALLDVKTSNEQVDVARQSIDLATEQLKEARDRYAAGVSGTLEVVQAQEAVANANETYIQALYLNNVAKLTLARALGVAEQQAKSFLGGK